MCLRVTDYCKRCLPHHAGVENIFFFCSSAHEDDSLSLNRTLLGGPNLNPDILGVLIHFRQHGTVFTVYFFLIFFIINKKSHPTDLCLRKGHMQPKIPVAKRPTCCGWPEWGLELRRASSSSPLTNQETPKQHETEHQRVLQTWNKSLCTCFIASSHSAEDGYSAKTTVK